MHDFAAFMAPNTYAIPLIPSEGIAAVPWAIGVFKPNMGRMVSLSTTVPLSWPLRGLAKQWLLGPSMAWPAMAPWSWGVHLGRWAIAWTGQIAARCAKGVHPGLNLTAQTGQARPAAQALHLPGSMFTAWTGQTRPNWGA